MTTLTTTDLASIINIYDNFSVSLKDSTYYRFVILHAAEYAPLGGGRWYVEGFRAISTYEWQIAKTYDVTGIKMYVRSKYNGVWSAWVVK